MKTLLLIILIPTMALAWELPAGLELVSVGGNHVTVRDTGTGLEDTYLIEGQPVINGWRLDPAEDSLIFEQVADLHMLLTEDLQAFDFLDDGYMELVGCDLLLNDDPLVFLENDGNYNFTEVNRIETGNILYDLGDADNDGLIEVLTQYNRSMFIYEQSAPYTFADSLIWHITPLDGNVRVWPRYSDLDDDGLAEISFMNDIDYYKIDIYENTQDNQYENYFLIPWPNTGPGQFASGDFDGDGHTEIVGGSDYGVLTIFESVASDSFEMVWQGDLGHPNAYMNKYIGDTDNDGFGEWVSGSHDFSHGGFFFRVYEGDGDNQYHEIYDDSLPGNPWLLGGIDSGDVDGDGSPEFIFSSNSNVGLFKHDPVSGWYRAWLMDSLDGSVLPYLVDCDGDGLDEILISENWTQAYTKFFKLIQTNINNLRVAYENEVEIFPNPANGDVTILYNISNQTYMNIEIYDILGRRVITLADEFQSPGPHSVTWDASQVASGMYFYKLASGEYSTTRRMTIIK